jgi:glutaredoxin-like protein NrdH
MKEFEKIEGKNKGKVTLYALSTCIWCRRTKQLLDELGVAYSYIYMDEADESIMDGLKKNLENWNPRCSFPTLVINDSKCIVGYEEEEIRKALG